MNATRWVAGALVLAILAAASFGVSAAITSQRAANVSRAPCQSSAVLTSFLDLTLEQQEQAAPICENYCTEQMAAREDLQESRARLMDALRQPRPYREDVDAALEDVGRAQARMQRSAAEYLLNIKPVLSEAQQAKLFDTVGQRFCQQGAGMGRMGGGQGRGGGLGRMKHLK